MRDDFKNLIEDIEIEAKAEGRAAEAEPRELRRELSIASQPMTLRRGLGRSDIGRIAFSSDYLRR